MSSINRPATRRALCLLFVIAGVAALAQTSVASPAKATSKSAAAPRIAFVCADTSIAFFVPIAQGAKDAAKNIGANVTYTGVGASDVTGPAQAKILNAALNQNPQALVVCNFFPSAEDPLIKKAVARGIPVFEANANSDAETNGVLGWVGQDDSIAGYQAGLEMAKAGVKHPLCVDDVPTNPQVASRCVGFVKALKSKGITAKTLNLPNAANNLTAVEQGVKGALLSDQSIDSVLALSNVAGHAVVLAAGESGRNVKVGTFDLSADVMQDIKSGKMLFAAWQEQYVQGYLPVIMAAQAIRYGMTATGQVNTGPIFVTKANLAKVAKAQAAGRA